jgi:hypothetical protein
MTYRRNAICHFFFSEGCACNVCDRSHLPSRGSAFRGIYCPTPPSSPSLSLLVSSGFPIKCQSIQVYHRHLVSPICGGGDYLESPVLLHFRLLLCVRPFFLFWRGRPLHNVPSLVFTQPTLEIISSPKICLTVLLNALFLPSRSWCLRSRSLKPLLHSGFGWRFFPKFRPLGVPFATSSLPCPLRPCPLRRANPERRVSHLRFSSETSERFGGI